MRAPRPPAVAAVAALCAAAACGASQPARVSAEPAARCAESGAIRETVPLRESLTTGQWAEIAVTGRGAAAVPIPGMEAVDVAIRHVISGTWPVTASTVSSEGTVDEAGAEQRNGARLLATASFQDEPDAPVEAVSVLAMRTDGSVRFLGGCRDRTRAPRLEAFRAARASSGDHRTQAELVLAVITEPDGELARSLKGPPTAAPVAWADQSPDERSLYDAPDEVLAALREIRVLLRLPGGWRDSDVAVCTRIPLAWNVCAAADASRGALRMPAYVSPGEPLEVWVTEAGSGAAGPRERALVVPPSALVGETLTLHGAAGVASRDDVFRLAREGRALRR